MPHCASFAPCTRRAIEPPLRVARKCIGRRFFLGATPRSVTAGGQNDVRSAGCLQASRGSDRPVRRVLTGSGPLLGRPRSLLTASRRGLETSAHPPRALRMPSSRPRGASSRTCPRAWGLVRTLLVAFAPARRGREEGPRGLESRPHRRRRRGRDPRRRAAAPPSRFVDPTATQLLSGGRPSSRPCPAGHVARAGRAGKGAERHGFGRWPARCNGPLPENPESP